MLVKTAWECLIIKLRSTCEEILLQKVLLHWHREGKGHGVLDSEEEHSEAEARSTAENTSLSGLKIAKVVHQCSLQGHHLLLSGVHNGISGSTSPACIAACLGTSQLQPL